MTEKRLRGTHDGRLVREAFIDGAWVEVPHDDLDELLDAADEGEPEAEAQSVPAVRGRGRPRKL